MANFNFSAFYNVQLSEGFVILSNILAILILPTDKCMQVY